MINQDPAEETLPDFFVLIVPLLRLCGGLTVGLLTAGLTGWRLHIAHISTGPGTGLRTAGDVYDKIIVSEVRVCSVHTVIGGEDRDIAGEDIELGCFKTLTALSNTYRRAFGSFGAYIQNKIAVHGVVACRDAERTAFNAQQLLGVYCIVHGGGDVKRELLDNEGCLALLIGRSAGLYAVFAVRGDVQCARAADSYLRAVLTFNYRVLRVFVVGALAGEKICAGCFYCKMCAVYLIS